MFQTDIDARELTDNMTEFALTQFPFALAKALNDTAFDDVRPGWRDEMPRVFDRPTRLTLGAVLVRRAKKVNPVAEIYLRNEASNATPTARYLIHQVEGGERLHKPFENILARAGIMSPDEFAVPGKSFPLDNYGNVPARVVQTVLKDVQAAIGEDQSGFSTPESRRRRDRRKKRRGGVYFLSRGKGTDLGKKGEQGLPRGIYERIRTGFGTAVRSVFVFVQRANYTERFDAYGLAKRLFDANFRRRFDQAMTFAIRTSKRKARRR